MIMNYYDEIKDNLLKSEIYDRVHDYAKDKNKVSVYFKVGKLLSIVGKEYGKNTIKQYSEVSTPFAELTWSFNYF